MTKTDLKMLKGMTMVRSEGCTAHVINNPPLVFSFSRTQPEGRCILVLDEASVTPRLGYL